MKRSEKNRMLQIVIESDVECKKLVRQMKKEEPTTMRYAELVAQLNRRKSELRALRNR